MKKRTLALTAALALGAAALTALPVAPANAVTAPIKCHLTYNLSGWSAIVQHATGSGWVHCDDGTKARVEISVHGGGLTAGKFKIVGGKGDISNVYHIGEVFGSYAQAGASAGAVNSGEAQVLTKGNVSVALAGTGQGWTLGVAVDKFDIEPVK